MLVRNITIITRTEMLLTAFLGATKEIAGLAISKTVKNRTPLYSSSFNFKLILKNFALFAK